MNTSSTTICSTCNVNFDNSKTFREHAKSQWHGVNAKRRLRSLEPLTLEVYLASPKNYVVFDSQSGEWECIVCRVSLSTERTLARHVASQDHKSQLAASDSSSEESDDETDPLLECLFCHHVAEYDELPHESMSDHELVSPNLSHMASEHGFRLPWQDNLPTENIPQLMFHLSTLVNDAKGCLWCWSSTEGKRRPFASSKAAKAHMCASDHCKVFVDPRQWHYDMQDASEVELGDLEIYWDFSEQLQDESTDEIREHSGSSVIDEDDLKSPSTLLQTAHDGLLTLDGKKIRARKTLGKGMSIKPAKRRHNIQRVTGKEVTQRVKASERATESEAAPDSKEAIEPSTSESFASRSQSRSPPKVTRKGLREIERYEKKHGPASRADRDLLLSGRMDILNLKSGGRSSAHLENTRQLAISMDQVSTVQKHALAAQKKTSAHALRYQLALSYMGNTGNRIQKKGNTKQGKPEWGWKV